MMPQSGMESGLKVAGCCCIVLRAMNDPANTAEEKLQDFSQELRRSFSGEIRMDRFSRQLYSTDASIYRIEPLGVLLPRSHDDVAAVVSLAGRYSLPVLPRGGGTSL